LNQTDEKARRAARWIWAGAILHLLGCGPLYLAIVGQMLGLVSNDANPIGLGLLFFFTAWPSLILIGIGVARGGWRHFKISFGK
jgi:hypothetical protein